MMAVHLVKSYCLPALLYSCEVWSLNDSALHSVGVAWNNSFRKIFNACWRESVATLQFYCNDMPVRYIIDQRKILFYKKLLRSENSILTLCFNLARNNVNALCAKYGVILSCQSANTIRQRVMNTFINTTVPVLIRFC